MFLWKATWAVYDWLWICALALLSLVFLIPFSFKCLSAAQTDSHSSSLSSVELVSASDDIHRFSAQVLYSEGTCICKWMRKHLHSESAWADSMRMFTNLSLQDLTKASCTLSRIHVFECLVLVVVLFVVTRQISKIPGPNDRLSSQRSLYHWKENE